jgi:hypothetical protein
VIHTRLAILSAASFCVVGCSDGDERLLAIDEVEAHCGFPAGTLNRSQMGEKFAINDEMSESSPDRARKTINLGEVMPHALAVAKRDCINNYRSSAGYQFSLGIVSPTTFPDDAMTPELLARQIPEGIGRLIESGAPQRGVVYLSRSDRLILHPKSLICELRPMIDRTVGDFGISGLGIDGNLLAKRMQELGLKGYVDGSPRQRPRESEGCSDNKLNIYYIGLARENRDGQPYRLSLAVWQGDRVWVGSVERVPNQLHSSTKTLLGDIEHPDRPPSLGAKIQASVRSDAQDLSAKMVQSLILGEAR